eukprot:m.152622 g.152622  ORF g.152622 m.152622 type:complete len:51 (+) comp17893_c0_seq37:1790-1942(+)
MTSSKLTHEKHRDVEIQNNILPARASKRHYEARDGSGKVQGLSWKLENES